MNNSGSATSPTVHGSNSTMTLTEHGIHYTYGEAIYVKNEKDESTPKSFGIRKLGKPKKK